MKTKIKLFDLYLLTLLLITVSSVTLRTIAIFTELNEETMHFDGKLTITISSILIILGVVLLSSYPFLSEKGIKLVAESSNAFTFIPSGLVAVSLLFVGANCFLKFSTDTSSGILTYLRLAISVLAVISAVSFFVCIFIEKNESQTKAAFFMGIIVFLVVYSSYLYFNKTIHPTNSPIKITDQMAHLFAALFFIYETRICLGREMWKPYVTFGLLSSLLCAYSSIPSLIIYIANGSVISDSVFESVLTLAICIFITLRVFKTKTLVKNEKAPETDKISALSRIREEELLERRTMANANDLEREDSHSFDEGETRDMENYTIDIKMPPAEYYGITEDTSIDQ